MRVRDLFLSETDIRSHKAKTWVVRADATDQRLWLANAPTCGAFAHYHIRHAGAAHMPAPFEIVRTKLSGSYFLACSGGEGRVRIDGRWVRCRPGMAVLLPPGALHAFHTSPDKSWDVCWVRYQEEAGQKPLATAAVPVLAQYDAEPLRLAILGLHRECTTHAAAGLAERWVELIHRYVTRFSQPATVDARLWQLWQKVSASLDAAWTVTDMARDVHLSEKQLQRLCIQGIGRTPRQQLIWLRMRQAAELLLNSDDKIETIANRVGYQNPFVFSSTFKRVMGCSPSEYPGRR